MKARMINCPSCDGGSVSWTISCPVCHSRGKVPHGLERGTQIVYVPGHAGRDTRHPDVEEGFVTSVKDDVVFCRFWYKDSEELRTRINSESVHMSDLVVRQSRDELDVRIAIERYCDL